MDAIITGNIKDTITAAINFQENKTGGIPKNNTENTNPKVNIKNPLVT